MLCGELHALSELLFKQSGVKAVDAEVGYLVHQVVQEVHHLGVEDDGVHELSQGSVVL